MEKFSICTSQKPAHVSTLLLMDIRPYSPDLKKTWDDFVWQKSRNGTLFHTRQFLEYHIEGKFEDGSLLFYDENKLRAVLTAVIEEGKEGKHLISHPGASYGGIVLSKKSGAAETLGIVELFCKYFRCEKFTKASFLRLTPTPLRRMPSDDLEYALLRHGFKLSRFELANTLPLDDLKEGALIESFDMQCRNKVRQAERAGVEVRLCDEYEAFWPILEEVLKERHHLEPTHTLFEMQSFKAQYPDHIRLFGAFKDKKLIAGLVSIDVVEHADYVLYTAQDFSHKNERPVNLLVTEAIRDSIRRGKRVIHIGVSTYDGGEKLNDGLCGFKEGFGAFCVRRESYTLDI